MGDDRKNEPRDYFLMLPASVARRWFNPAVLYAEILSLSRNGPCVASDAFFAERYNVGLRTVRYALKSLESAGLIERKRAGTVAREIVIKGGLEGGKISPGGRQDFAGCRQDVAGCRQDVAKSGGKMLPNSNISLVNSLSKQALPTDQEVFGYARQIGLPMDAAEQFVRQMEADGWQIDGQPVRSWKALLKSRLQWQTESENGGMTQNEPKQEPERRVGIHL